QQAITVKPFDVVALVRTTITPDMDIVLFHGCYKHGACHGTPYRRGVEVRDPGSRDMKGTTLQRSNALCCQLGTAVNQACFLGAVLHGLAWYGVVIGLVGLAQIGGVGIRNGALVAHPQQSGASVKAAGKRDTDLLTDRNSF